MTRKNSDNFTKFRNLILAWTNTKYAIWRTRVLNRTGSTYNMLVFISNVKLRRAVKGSGKVLWFAERCCEFSKTKHCRIWFFRSHFSVFLRLVYGFIARLWSFLTKTICAFERTEYDEHRNPVPVFKKILNTIIISMKKIKSYCKT